MTKRMTGRFCKCGQPLPLNAKKYCGNPECYKCPHGRVEHGRLCFICKGSGVCPHLKQKEYCPICDPKSIYRVYKNSAHKRGLAFALTLEEFERLLLLPCVYCGQYAGGIDRSDSTQGYTRENSLPCCGLDNIAKQTLSKAEYLAHIQRVYNHQRGDSK